MTAHRSARRFTALAGAVVLGATTAIPASGIAAEQPKPAGHDITDPAEAKRVDSVTLPESLDWKDCETDLVGEDTTVQCTTLDVPLDYDNPEGASFTLDIARRPANNRTESTKVLFVNPGGPSGSSRKLAANAAKKFGAEVLDSFDVVGIDPRGVGPSLKTQCFDTAAEQAEAIAPMFENFPITAAETDRYIELTRKYAKGCGEAKGNLTQHHTTAQVARDMDVVRRALGEDQLTYFGYSYGTHLGQMYANMFPDRVRAMTLDAVVDSDAWTGNNGQGEVQFNMRMRESQGTIRALKEALRLCDVHADKCAGSAAEGEPTAAEKYEKILAAASAEGGVKRKAGNDDSELPQVLRVNLLTNLLVRPLYAKGAAPERIGQVIRDIWDVYLAEDTSDEDSALAVQRLVAVAEAPLGPGEVRLFDEDTPAPADPEPEPYDHGSDTFLTVLCGDGIHPQYTSASIKQVREAQKTNPFAARWGFQTVLCAGDSWVAEDKSRYLGPFNKKVSGPILFIGSLYDPATNVERAMSASLRQPDAGLLLSDNWGHGAYGSSDCVNNGIDNVLLKGQMPQDTWCVSDKQPFQEDVDTKAVWHAGEVARPLLLN